MGKMMRTLMLLVCAGLTGLDVAAQTRTPQEALPVEHLGLAEEAVSFAFADVLSVEPIYETVETRRPREQCFERRSSRDERYNNTTTGTIVGAIIGGAAGNRVGDGNGRRAATVAGAVIGGLVGREVDASNNPGGRRTTSRTECEVVDEIVEEQQVAGYDVQYRYRGEVYLSRLSYDPGSKLRIRVAISPAEQ